MAFKRNAAAVCLDTIYIDSTFFKKSYLNFPDQRESSTAICDHIGKWLQRSSEHVVALRTCARYGYEYLFKTIAERFGASIHVNASELQKYKYFPELDGCFTASATNSRIHACFSSSIKNNSPNLSCNCELDTKLILVIRPTAMLWTNWQRWQAIHSSSSDNEQFIRVCYSNHASYTEVKDLLDYLRPKHVELNVLPNSAVDRKQMMADLDEVMSGFNDEGQTAAAGLRDELLCNGLKFDQIEFNDEVEEAKIKEYDSSSPPSSAPPICLMKRRKMK